MQNRITFVLVGMTVLYYIGFFIVSWFLLMLIYNFSTYHKYFKFAGPGLIGYGIFVGFLLYSIFLNTFSTDSKPFTL